MKISIIGLGWYGSALSQLLSNQYEVLGTTRSPSKLESLSAFGTVQLLDESNAPSGRLLDSEAVVLNIPPFAQQLEWFKSWEWNSNTHLVFISSTSVYGDLQGIVTEETEPSPNTENGKILLEEEKWVKSFPHYTIIRFGGLIGEDRHPGKYLSGKSDLSNGNSPVNLTHLEDCIRFTQLVLEKKIVNQTFNLVSPNHPPRKEYYKGYCKNNNLPLPHFVDSEDTGKIIAHEKVSKIYLSRNV